MGTLAGDLEREASRLAGRVGFAVSNLKTGESVFRLEDDSFPTASTVKLPVLTAFHAFVDEGHMGWDELVRIDTKDLAGGSGVLQHLDLPREISYRDAAWLMICLSDNMATNILLRALTIDGANRLIAEVIGDGIRLVKFAGYSAGAPARSMGQATPQALGKYLNDLAADRLPGSAATKSVATEQIYRNTIPRYLPHDPYRPSTLTIANKTGGMPGICADIAVVTRANTIVTMAFMADSTSVRSGEDEKESQRCIGRMSRIVYNTWLAAVA